jgi:hypothetical protein
VRWLLTSLALLAALSVPASAQRPTPTGAVTSVAASATGTTSAVVATLPAVASKTNYLCTVDISELQGSTAGSFSATVSGLVGSVTFTYEGSNAASSASTISRTFTPCIGANGANSAISVTANANANAAAVSVNLTGYAQ